MLKKISVRRFLIAVLSVLMVITPVSGAFATTQLIAQETPTYIEFSEDETNSLKEEALNSNEVKSLLDEMKIAKFNPQTVNAYKWTYQEEEGYLVMLASKTPKEVQIVYSKYKDKVNAGSGLSSSHGNNKTVEVYDYVDGKVYKTSSISSIGSDIIVNWENGPYAKKAIQDSKKSSLSSSPQAQGEISTYSTSYTICNFVCSAIAYGGGCSLTGYFACSAACASFAGPTCLIICGVVYGVVCSGAGFYNCDWMCRDLGFTP